MYPFPFGGDGLIPTRSRDINPRGVGELERKAMKPRPQKKTADGKKIKGGARHGPLPKASWDTNSQGAWRHTAWKSNYL